MSFRANLQYLRAQRNLTQERLAMLLGVSRQAISKWESGLTHLTTARCAQLVRFLRSDLQGFTGRLSRNDAIRVANAVGEVKPEEQVWL